VSFLSRGNISISLSPVFVVGWLLKKPQSQSEIIFNTFKAAWSDTYRYVVRELQPKMEVCSYLSSELYIRPLPRTHRASTYQISANSLGSFYG